MGVLNPYTSMSFFSLCIIILIYFPNCHTKNNKNKQLAFAAVLFGMNNSNPSCDAEIISSNIHQTRNIIANEIDCKEISNFKFDSRIFTPLLNSNVYQLKFENLISIELGGNNYLSLMPTVLFNTSQAIVFDSLGYKTNPRIYNYAEYRAMIFLKNGTYTAIEGISGESVQSAYLEAFQKCQKEFLQK